MSKIQELKNQCYYEVQEGRNAFETYTVTRFDTDKFAELIVQECAALARNHLLNEADRSYMIHKKIKEHFGVE